MPQELTKVNSAISLEGFDLLEQLNMIHYLVYVSVSDLTNSLDNRKRFRTKSHSLHLPTVDSRPRSLSGNNP